MKSLIIMMSVLCVSFTASASEEVFPKINLTGWELTKLAGNCSIDDSNDLSKQNLIKRLKYRTLELEGAIRTEEMYRDLAKDASETSDRANLVGSAGEIGIAAITGGAIALGYLGAGAVGTLGLSYEVVTAHNYLYVVDENKSAADAFSQTNCSYKQMYDILTAKQSELYNQLDDKLFAVKNALRFGKKMKNLSIELYAVSVLKRQLIESELVKLSELATLNK